MELLGVIVLSFVLSYTTDVVVKKLRVREHFSGSVRAAALDAISDQSVPVHSTAKIA
ncbi:MAG: hypothetical protein ABJA82_01865 [Myxococcales bacterium]